MTILERGIGTPAVSLARLLDGNRARLEGSTDMRLEGYVEEILRSGFPGIRQLDPRLARAQLDGYVDHIVERVPGDPSAVRDGTLVGGLFESLVTQSVRVYAQRIEARVGHLRTRRGEHEVDLIVERGQTVVAIEAKLGAVVDDGDVRQLLWLREKLGDELADAAVVTTGREAYRRKDGIAVVPLALLGP